METIRSFLNKECFQNLLLYMSQQRSWAKGWAEQYPRNAARPGVAVQKIWMCALSGRLAGHDSLGGT